VKSSRCRQVRRILRNSSSFARIIFVVILNFISVSIKRQVSRFKFLRRIHRKGSRCLASCILCLATCILLFSSNLLAEKWEKSLDFSLNLTQNSYSDNWVGGEAGSFNWMSNLNSSATKQLSKELNLKNTLKLAFGQTHQQDKDSKKWRKPTKSTDLIDFESVLRFTLNAWVDPYFAARLETQFLDAEVSEVKRYFNPIKFSESAGIAKVFYKKEKSEFLTRFGLGLRQYIQKEITDTSSAKTEVKTANDGGIESVTDFKIGLADGKINYTTKLTLFKAIFYSKKEELYWKCVDVNWENIFSSSITTYLKVFLYVQFLYDKQIEKKGRFKETLALGLTYRFF